MKMREDRTVVIGTANKIALNFYKRIKCQVFIREWNVTMFHCSLQGGGRIQGDRGWDGWMASPTQWTRVSVNSVMDREAWRAAVHGVSKSQTRLSDGTVTTSEQVWAGLPHCAVRRKEVFLGASHKQPGKIRQLKPAAEGVWTATSGSRGR